MLPLVLHLLLLAVPESAYQSAASGLPRRARGATGGPTSQRPPPPPPPLPPQNGDYRPKTIPPSQHVAFRRSLPIPDFSDARHTLPADPRLWSNWHVYHFLDSVLGLPAMADACALRVSKFSFEEVDGPELLRLGLEGLRRELGLTSAAEIPSHVYAAAMAKWAAWPWPPNLFNASGQRFVVAEETHQPKGV